MVRLAACLLAGVAASGAATADNGGLETSVGSWRLGWPELDAALTGDLNGYLEVLWPVLEATRLTYTSTHCSYFKPAEAGRTLLSEAGWKRRSDLEENPELAGMAALAFEHEESKRALFAFRGTDLNSSHISGQADLCADKLLWDEVPFVELPDFCRDFSVETLDYLRSAIRWYSRAAEALRGYEILVTGHSLGAGLGLLAGAAQMPLPSGGRRPKVLGFASPSIVDALRKRLDKDPTELDPHAFAIIFNSDDPIYHQALEKGITGTMPCTFDLPSGHPASCVACFGPESPERTQECNACFAATHTYGVYQRVLNGSAAKPPSVRPACKLAAASASSDVLV